MKYNIIGDIHGCFFELDLLLKKLKKIDNRKIIFVGDITDRGPNSAECIELIMDLVSKNQALCVMGNHDNKLMRFCLGRNVVQNNGLEKTIKQIFNLDKNKIENFISNLPYYLILDDGNLIVVHAAWKDILSDERQARNWCLYGPTTGKKLENGYPDRIDWVSKRKSKKPLIIYGHQTYLDPRIENNTIGIDTGCVYGGFLTAVQYPEINFIKVKAFSIWDNSKSEFIERHKYDKKNM